ncbi:radical SAM protein [Iodobacter sp. CM08]|uniref:radical SAM protein n=1 Tax=Iodobacter sp. CM08 TaxID=3085902 RepID=UPI002980D754|nr:radical SAM protein [Iodobacter sp. CM08]MDW5416187.1 radical SAM protein [Iodobacter sp. CM08]
MNKSSVAGYMNPLRLELIVFPTEQCNFRCTYCYEDFEIGQMKDSTVEAIKKLILNRLPSLNSFKISWFGGEPLLAKKIVLELNKFAQDQCELAGVAFSSSMTTNAFSLNKDTFDDLVKADVLGYQISLDGDEEEHNKTRKMASGRGSFSKIWSNLLATRESNAKFHIKLRLHVHKDNVESIKSLLEKINAEFGKDPRFTISIKAVGNWGGTTVKSMNLMKSSNEVIDDLNVQLEYLGWFLARPFSEKNNVFNPCYAAKPNSFVIRADGKLGKCTVALSDTRNSIGHINDDGTLFIENEKMRTFMRGFQSLDEKALHCPMHEMPKNDEVKIIKFEKKVDINMVNF